jgi:hypothetical protein
VWGVSVQFPVGYGVGCCAELLGNTTLRVIVILPFSAEVVSKGVKFVKVLVAGCSGYFQCYAGWDTQPQGFIAAISIKPAG